jgi:hypothetical protein
LDNHCHGAKLKENFKNSSEKNVKTNMNILWEDFKTKNVKIKREGT